MSLGVLTSHCALLGTYKLAHGVVRRIPVLAVNMRHTRWPTYSWGTHQARRDEHIGLCPDSQTGVDLSFHRQVDLTQRRR